MSDLSSPDLERIAQVQAIADKAGMSDAGKESLVQASGLPTLPTRVQILVEGAKLTNGDRDAEYGDPRINLACAGALKAVVRKYMAREMDPGELEAIDQVLTKVARVTTGKKPKRDTYVDGATYFAIAGECANV